MAENKPLIPVYSSLIPRTDSLIPRTESLIPRTDTLIPTYEFGQEPKPSTPADQQPSYLVRMNDPFQINSLVDVIFNSEAIRRKYGSSNFGNHLKAAWDLFDEFTWQPLIHGQFGALGINALASLNEVTGLPTNIIKAVTTWGSNVEAEQVDYDVAAQLVANAHGNKYASYGVGAQKRYVAYVNGKRYDYTDYDLKTYEEIVNSGRTVNPYKLTTGERVKAAIGIGQYGQINYNYNTGGGWVTDMFLEIISDPTTWVSLGASAAASSAGKASINVAKSAFKDIEASMLKRAASAAEVEFVKDLLNQFADEATGKIMAKEAIKYLRDKSVTMSLNQNGVEWISKLLGDAVKEAATGNTWKINDLAQAMTVALYKGTDNSMSYTAPMVRDILQETMQAIPNQMSVNVLKILDPLDKAQEAVNRVLVKAALTPSGIYPVYKLVKKSPAVAGWIVDMFNSGAEAYVNKLGDWSILSYEDGLKSYNKTLQTIGNALNDGDKLLLGSDYEKRFGRRIAADEVFFGDFFEQLTEQNADEMITTFTKYMDEAHKGMTLSDVIKAAKTVFEKFPESQLDLQSYIKHLQDYANRLYVFADQAGVSHKSAQILNAVSVFDRPDMPIVQDLIFTKNVKKYFTPEMMVRDLQFVNIVAAIETTKDEISNMVTRFTFPLKTLTAESGDLVDGFVTRVTAIYDKYFAELEQYAMDFDPKYDTWEFKTPRNIIAGLNNEYNAFVAALQDIDTNNFLNVEKVTLNHSTMKALAEQVYPGNMGNFGKLMKAVEKVSALTPELKNPNIVQKNVPMNWEFVKKDAYKTLFGKYNMADYADIEEWLSQFHEIFKLNDKLTNEPFLKQSPESLSILIHEFFTNPDEAEYVYNWTKFNEFIQKIIYAIENNPDIAAQFPTEFTQHYKDGDIIRSPILREFLEDMGEISPEARQKASQLVPVWTTLYQYKQEQMAALVEIMTDKSAIDFARELSEYGDIGIMLRDKLKNEENVAVQKLLHDIIDPVDQYYATKKLFQRLGTAQFTDTHTVGRLADSTRVGVTSAIQKFFNTEPNILRIDIEKKLDQIILSAETFIQQTKQADISLSLDTFFEDHIDDINAFRQSIGFDAIEKEMHIAVDDTITNFVLLQELAKSDQELQAMIDSGVRFVAFDLESINANEVAHANVGHQYAYTVWDGTKLVELEQRGLKADVISDGLLPSKVLLDKYFDPAEYTDAEQLAEYLRTRSGDVENEADLFYNLISDLWKQVKDTYDPVSKTYRAAFVTHNGASFDKPLIRSKIRQFGSQARGDLYHRFREAGIDLSFIEDIRMIDTLKKQRDTKNFFYVTGEDRAILKTILMDYADDMIKARGTQLFSAFDTMQMINMRKALKELGDAATETEQSVYKTLTDRLNNISETFTSIRNQNKEYARSPIAKLLFQGPLADDSFEIAEKKIEFMKQALRDTGMNDAEITARYGDFSNVNASTFLSAQGDYQPIAYKIRRNVELIDAWFVGSSLRIGELTELEAQQMNGVAYALEGIASRVLRIETYTKYMDRMKELVPIMMADPRFKFLKYLRTDNLNVPSQWAVFSYLASKYDKDTEELLTKVFKVRHLKELSPQDRELYTLLVSSAKKNRYKKAFSSTDQWMNDYLSETIQYAKDYESMLNLQMTLDDFNKLLGHNNMFDGGSQLTKKAVLPAARMIESLEAAYRHLENLPNGRNIAYEFYRQERDAADLLSRHILKGFLNLDVDNMSRWLASSNGFVVFRKADLETADVDGFLTKMLGDEFLKANIAVADDGEYAWIYLTKQANLRASISNDFQKVKYHINGVEFDRYGWAQNDIASVKDAYKMHMIEDLALDVPAQFHKAESMLYYMTDGASGSSMYELFRQNNLQETFLKMPADMRDNFYSYKELTSPAMWKQAQYNHSVLGTTATRQQFINSASDNMARAIAEATVKRAEGQGAVLTYAAALFDGFSALNHETEIGRLAASNPKAIVDYFKGHPEYTAAVLVKDTRNKLGFKVLEVPMDSVRNVQRAVDMGARIMTIPEFHKSWEVINENIWSETGMSVWQKIVRVYKIGYLSSPGTWMRNAMDSFIKNMTVTGENPLTTAKYYKTALRDIHEYNGLLESLYAWGHGRIPDDPEEIAAFFKGYKGSITAERYEYLKKFFNDAVAGGEASVYRKHAKAQQEEYMSALLEAGNITPDTAKLLSMKRDFNALTGMMLNPMNVIERVARLAEYDMLSASGHTAVEAIALIEKTHYAYSVKSEIEQTLELIIPFYTFASRNLNFWMDMIEENPDIFSYFRDIFEPAWNLEQYNHEELEGNRGLQTSIMSGNIPLYNDYVLKTSFSFMDALTIMTDFANQVDNRIWAPVQTVINIWLQGAADESYRKGNAAMSNWMQETFGLKVTEEQLRAKYGEWADEYMKLYPYAVSGMNARTPQQKIAEAVQFVPLVGTIIQRLMTTDMYYDGEGLGALLYMAGVSGKIRMWPKEEQANKAAKLYTKITSLIADNQNLRGVWAQLMKSYGYPADTNIYSIRVSDLQSMWKSLAETYYSEREPALGSKIYEMLQADDDNIWLYSRLKTALGYGEVPLGKLPDDIKELIFSTMNNQTPVTEVPELFKDAETIPFMWKSLLQKNKLTGVPFDKIPTETFNAMVLDIAQGAVVAMRVLDLLQNDPTSRYSYAVAKNKLGYKGIKMTQLPTDALELVYAAMLNHVYMPHTGTPGTSKQFKSVVLGLRKKPASAYSSMSFTDGTPYDTHKGVYANYGHNTVRDWFKDSNVYEDNYTVHGTSRMSLMMRDLNPKRMQYRIHHMANMMT